MPYDDEDTVVEIVVGVPVAAVLVVIGACGVVALAMIALARAFGAWLGFC